MKFEITSYVGMVKKIKKDGDKRIAITRKRDSDNRSKSIVCL